MKVRKNNQFFAHMVTYGYTERNGTEWDSHSEICNDCTESAILFRKWKEEKCKEIGDWVCIDDIIIEVNVNDHGNLETDIVKIDCHAFYRKEK